MRDKLFISHEMIIGRCLWFYSSCWQLGVQLSAWNILCQSILELSSLRSIL